MKKCLLGVLSWCDDKKYPERFKTFKDCVESIERCIPKNLCMIAIVDNNSSDKVKDYIKKSSTFDIKVLLPENIHDTGGYAVLAKICKDNNLEYFFPIDNDHVFYQKGFLKPCLKMLDTHPECGYIRLLKFEYNKKDYYDKAKQRLKNHDKTNEIWMYNIVSGQKLSWKGPFKKDNFSFYINNWHWATCGPLVKLSLWKQIFPKFEGFMPVYYDSERIMRENYQKLGLKTLVLDGGAFSQKDISVYQASFGIFAGTLINNFLKQFKKNKRPTIEALKVLYYQNNYQKFVL